MTPSATLEAINALYADFLERGIDILSRTSREVVAREADSQPVQRLEHQTPGRRRA